MRTPIAIALVLASAALPAAAQAAEPPATGFDFEVAPRVATAEPTREYVRPRKWDVILEACPAGQATVAPDADGFVWSVPVQPVTIQVTTTDKPLRRPCRFRMSVHAQGVYQVSLRREAPDGTLSRPVTRDVTVTDRLVVALGDSIASGEGNPDVSQKFDLGFNTAPARWQSRQCHRSERNAPMARVARELEAADRHSAITFVNLACSGAAIEGEGLLAPYAGIEPGPQLAPQLDRLEALARTRPIDAVVISAGANDIGFGDIVTACFEGNCDRSAGVRARLDTALRALPGRRGRFDNLAKRLSRLGIPAERVYVTEYPDPTTDARGRHVRLPGILGKGVPLKANGISARELAWAAREVVAPLNAAVRAAAENHNWSFVGGIAQGFIGHGYAAGKASFIRTAESAMELQGPWPPGCNRLDPLTRSFKGHCRIPMLLHLKRNTGPLHPSEGGVALIARTILGRITFGPAVDPARSLPAVDIDGPARRTAGPGNTASTIKATFAAYPQNLRAPLAVRWTVDGVTAPATGESAQLSFALPARGASRTARVTARITDADGRTAEAARTVTISSLDRPNKPLPGDTGKPSRDELSDTDGGSPR